jgi:hypothetical protein
MRGALMDMRRRSSFQRMSQYGMRSGQKLGIVGATIGALVSKPCRNGDPENEPQNEKGPLESGPLLQRLGVASISAC